MLTQDILTVLFCVCVCVCLCLFVCLYMFGSYEDRPTIMPEIQPFSLTQQAILVRSIPYFSNVFLVPILIIITIIKNTNNNNNNNMYIYKPFNHPQPRPIDATAWLFSVINVFMLWLVQLEVFLSVFRYQVASYFGWMSFVVERCLL